MGVRFDVLGRDPESGARQGELKTGRSTIATPVFMPVGTAGSVKAMFPAWLEELRAGIILANTYHLHLRPGTEVISAAGGLHGFMSWPASILTDSGGYQVFSHAGLNRVSEEGVEFQSHLDGSRHFLTPEKSIEIQLSLASDIMMAFDECTSWPASATDVRRSMELSMRWLVRSREAAGDRVDRLFGIVQGGLHLDLRIESLERVVEQGLPGLALGGFSVGEPRQLMYEVLEGLAPRLPAVLPHYLMGVGTPLDIVTAVQAGCDMFDCVLPTRNARRGHLFTWKGPIRIKNARYTDDQTPLDPDCRCPVCCRFSRAYLRHLFVSNELLSPMLNSYHNLYFYMELMERTRAAIPTGGLRALEAELKEAYA